MKSTSFAALRHAQWAAVHGRVLLVAAVLIVWAVPPVSAQPWGYAPTETCSVVSPALERVTAASIATGSGASVLFARELEMYLARPSALAEVRAAYDYAGRHHARALLWTSVYIATFIHSESAVTFLREVALIHSTPSAPPPSLTGNADEPGWSPFQAQLMALTGIVDALVAGIANANTALQDTLLLGDTGIAQMLGVELYSRGRLTPSYRGMIEARGIFAGFRPLTAAEKNAYALGDISRLRAPNKVVRANSPQTPPRAEGQ